MVWIIIIIFLGTFFWFGNLNVLTISRDWPLIIVFFGILNIFTLVKGNKRKKIIDDLERGKINAQEAETKLKKIK